MYFGSVGSALLYFFGTSMLAESFSHSRIGEQRQQEKGWLEIFDMSIDKVRQKRMTVRERNDDLVVDSVRTASEEPYRYESL